MLLLLMMSLASFAGPRSFQQAKEIALRQAAQLGISMDETSSAKAKSKRVKSVSGEVPAYYVFPNGEGKGFTVVSGVKWWAIPIRVLTMRRICQATT